MQNQFIHTIYQSFGASIERYSAGRQHRNIMTQQDLPDSNYLLPYNEAEIRRLRLQHDLIQSYMGGLILAPINFEQKGLKILDSGTFDGESCHRNTQLKPEAEYFAHSRHSQAFGLPRHPSWLLSRSSSVRTFLRRCSHHPARGRPAT